MAQTLPLWWGIFGAPLLAALLATAGAWVAISFDRKKTVNQELIRKRIEIYDQVAPRLNDLYCFALSVGQWKQLAPPSMIDHKRVLDRTVYIYGPLFSANLVQRYHTFIHTMFLTYTAVGQAAQLRISRLYLEREWDSEWDENWNLLFAGDDHEVSDSDVRGAYNALMTQFAAEIGAERQRHPARPRRKAVTT